MPSRAPMGGRDWARLFRAAPGYRGTELLRDEEAPGRYLTIDRWAAQADFAAFKKTSGALYEAIGLRDLHHRHMRLEGEALERLARDAG